MNQPAPPSKGLKIRLSCDSCQRSKVRCGQERPTCRKCLKHGIECVYSPSRRAGRPRTRKTAIDTSLPASKQQQQQQQPDQHQEQQQHPALSTPTNKSPCPEQCSPPRSPHGEDTIVVAITQPSGATAAAATTTTTPPPALIQFLGRSPAPSVPPNPADSANGRDESFPDLIRFSGTDIFTNMFAEVSHHQTPHMHQDPALDFDLLLSPLETIDFAPKESSLDCFAASHLTPVAVSAPSSESDASQPNAALECSCSVTLLEQLAQLPAASSQSGELTSLASAVSQSRPLLDQCHTVLCCPRCAPRFSSILMACEAIDKVSVALDMGPLWDKVNRDCPFGGRAAISTKLTRDDSPLRCGSYTIGGGDRRAVLRVLITKRLTELQGIMTKLQTTLESPGIAGSALHKPCADLVSEFAAKLTSNINLIKVHL